MIVVINATYLTLSDRGSRNASRKRARCTPFISRSFKRYPGVNMFWLESTPILRENTVEVVRGLQPLFTLHQPQGRSFGSTAI
ncbi:hypothetical protein TNCV_4482931 [Trichonephila clavipes]|nr:hypothetical protein TNCV_4482931 [Trichonephila clavipes]